MLLAEMSLRVRVLQIRRVRCDRCRVPFSYLGESRETIVSYGIALLGGGDGMRRALRRRALERLREISRRADFSEAPCATCHRYTHRMVALSRRRLALMTVPGALSAGWLAALCAHFGSPEGLGVLPFLGVTAVAVGVGWGCAVMLGLSHGEADAHERRRSANDHHVRELLQRCAATGTDPAGTWYGTLQRAPDAKETQIPAGCVDRTGEDFFPAQFTADAVLRDEE